jgi:hypothetical protein
MYPSMLQLVPKLCVRAYQTLASEDEVSQ